MPDGNLQTAPLYLTLANSIARDIESGRYPVGSLLPTEREICEAHDCSRHTAREALKLLVDRGQVVRRRGSGSVVTSRRASGRYVQSVDSLNELIRYTADARLDVIGTARVKADAGMAEEHGIREGTGWIRLEGLRRTSDTAPPICWTVFGLAERFAGLLDDIGHRAVPVYTLIEERFGERIVEVEQTMDATAVSSRIADLLDCRPGSPALKTTRRYLGENRDILMVADSIHPAGRTRFATTLRRQSSPEGD